MKPIKTTGIRSKYNFSTSQHTCLSREESNAARHWRYANDPEYRERRIAQVRQNYAHNNEYYRACSKARQRERYINNPEFRARKLAANRARFANIPQSDEERWEKARVRYRWRLENEEGLREKRKTHNRLRYAKDPEYRKRISEASWR